MTYHVPASRFRLAWGGAAAAAGRPAPSTDVAAAAVLATTAAVQLTVGRIATCLGDVTRHRLRTSTSSSGRRHDVAIASSAVFDLGDNVDAAPRLQYGRRQTSGAGHLQQREQRVPVLLRVNVGSVRFQQVVQTKCYLGALGMNHFRSHHQQHL